MKNGLAAAAQLVVRGRRGLVDLPGVVLEVRMAHELGSALRASRAFVSHIVLTHRVLLLIEDWVAATRTREVCRLSATSHAGNVPAAARRDINAGHRVSELAQPLSSGSFGSWRAYRGGCDRGCSRSALSLGLSPLPSRFGSGHSYSWRYSSALSLTCAFSTSSSTRRTPSCNAGTSGTSAEVGAVAGMSLARRLRAVASIPMPPVGIEPTTFGLKVRCSAS
jgi:hypothetical protein